MPRLIAAFLFAHLFVAFAPTKNCHPDRSVAKRAKWRDLLCPRLASCLPSTGSRRQSVSLRLWIKKEVESPKLTANFLIWISAFMVLLFVLIAHFVRRVF
jgi:hypothetical protein